MEKDKSDLAKGASSGNKEKLFADKLKKINSEIADLDRRIRDLNTKKDKNEMRVEQCKRDADELKGKIEQEEKRLQSEGGAQIQQREERLTKLKNELSQMKSELTRLQ